MSESLFKYQVRVSPKARNVRLRVTLQQGLEVVVPKGYDEKKIPGLLERKKHWVRAALERAEATRKFFEPEPVWRLPMQIKLPAIGAVWHVSSKQTDAKWASVNAKLLFLPPTAVDYAIIHELCHLAQMNHSAQFWQLVQVHYPDYKRIDARLRERWKLIPRWAS